MGAGCRFCESRIPKPKSRLQRIPDIRTLAQRHMRRVVLLAVLAAEADRDRDEIAAAGMPVAHAFMQHAQPRLLQQLRHPGGQVGAGAAHRGDLEITRELESLAFLLRLGEVDRLHYFASAACSVLSLLPWNHNRMVSHRREKKPPFGASASATSGTFCTGWPARVTRRVPTCRPFLNGAIRVAGMSMVALSLS